MKIFWISILKMLGLFWWLAWERPTDGSRGRVGGRHASPCVGVVRWRGWLELVKLLHGDTSVYLQIHLLLQCFLSHHKSSSQTIMFSPENHLDTRAASSPHDGSSSTLCTRTLSAFCLCWTLCCVRCIWLINWWVFSRLLQRGGARKTLQRWESRWFGKHFKQKNSNAYRPQYKSFSAGVDTWWRSTSWQPQN